MGPVAEAAFLHRPTATLLVTDAVVYVPPAPPDVLAAYFGDSAARDPDFWPKSVLQVGRADWLSVQWVTS